MSGYPKASCDPGTVALRLANERADRWKQRHDALAARLASVEALAAEWDALADTMPPGDYRAGWGDALDALRAVLGSDAHTEQKGAGRMSDPLICICGADLDTSEPCRKHPPCGPFPVTASDARPPSDTGATGYVIDPTTGYVYHPAEAVAARFRPVLVVDPAEARKTIARALDGHEGIRWVKKLGGWDCWCGHELTARWAPALSVEATGPWRDHIAGVLAAALAGQEQP